VGPASSEERVLISCHDFFFGCKIHGFRPTFLRLWILTMLATGVLGIGILITIVSADHTVQSHRCEQDYHVWPHMISNMALYIFAFVMYCATSSPSWAQCHGWTTITWSTANIVWSGIITLNMAHICERFYEIKYPLLLLANSASLFFNILLLVNFGCREFSVFLKEDVGNNGVDVEQPDATMVTSVFTVQNKHYKPSLFIPARVKTYHKGVKNWSVSVTDRNKTLKDTLEKAEKIHKSSTDQSALLSQVTNLVKETDKKVSKALNLIKQQEALIGEMNDVVLDASNRLDNQSAKISDWKLGCTWGDGFKWCAICVLCALIVGSALVAVPKWLHLFGIELGINI